MAERKKLSNFAIAGAQEFKKQKLPEMVLYAEKKMDGQRGIIIVHKGVARAYTKSGCSVSNADHILKAVEQVFDECVLDGEYLYKKNFNKTQSIVMSMSIHPDRKGLQFNAFDYLTYSEWKNKKCKTRLSKRKSQLGTIIKENKTMLKRLVNFVEHAVIFAKKEKLYAFMEEQAKLGHEGGMFKDPNSFYAFKKTSDWLKLKPYKECDCKIIDAIEGRPGKTGKYVGMLGALVVTGVVDDTPVQFQCSGMLDKDRKEWWAMHKKKELVGKTVEVKHEGITVNGAVRFPRIMRLKLDKKM